MSIIEDLKWRYATKKFNSDLHLSAAQIELLKEAINLTPSSYGMQPLHYYFISDKQTKEQILEHSYRQNQVVDASLLIVFCVQTNLTEKHTQAYIDNIADIRKQTPESLDGFKNMMNGVIERMSSDEQLSWAAKQAYIALGNIMTVCATQKLDACPMEGFNPKGVDEILDLESKGLKSVLMLPVGYRATDDEYIKREKVRMKLDDIITNI